MTSILIQKRSDPVVARLRAVRDGASEALLFCEGLKVLEEMLRSHISAQAVYCLAEREDDVRRLLTEAKRPAPITLLTEPVMKFVSDLSTPPGVIALARRPTPAASAPTPPISPALVLVLHGLQLPQNVGALIRTAEGAGVSAVVTTANTADPFGPKVIRGSSGSVFRVSVRAGASLADLLASLRSEKISAVAAVQTGETEYDTHDWTQPTALVVGSEGAGFSPEEFGAFEARLKIPMAGRVESLNVASAAAVCLFEAARQRRAAKKSGGSHGNTG